MTATRAYIASAGTAAAMLGASVCVFALLSAFVAFGSWPGTASHTSLDQIVLRSVERPHAASVTVRPDAVAVAQRQSQRAVRTLASAKPGRGAASTPGAPSSPSPTRQLAAVPTTSKSPVRSIPAGTSTPDVVATTKQVTDQAQTQAKQVQDQVNQVVQQVIGGPAPDASSTVTQAQGTVGGVLGH